MATPGSPTCAISLRLLLALLLHFCLLAAAASARFTLPRPSSPRACVFPSMAAMELFENARSVRLKSHLGTYLCTAADAEAVSHGYRRNSRGTVWAVEHAGDEYVRLQGQRGLYLGAADPAAALNAATPSCSVVQGVPSTPNDSAFLWTPRREDERGAAGCLTLSGPLDRLLRDSFGDTHKAVSLDFDVAPEESAWVLEAVPAEQAARPPPCRAQSCDARMQVTAATLDTTSSSFVRFYSAKAWTVWQQQASAGIAKRPDEMRQNLMQNLHLKALVNLCACGYCAFWFHFSFKSPGCWILSLCDATILRLCQFCLPVLACDN